MPGFRVISARLPRPGGFLAIKQLPQLAIQPVNIEFARISGDLDDKNEILIWKIFGGKLSISIWL